MLLRSDSFGAALPQSGLASVFKGLPFRYHFRTLIFGRLMKILRLWRQCIQISRRCACQKNLIFWSKFSVFCFILLAAQKLLAKSSLQSILRARKVNSVCLKKVDQISNLEPDLNYIL